MLVSNYARMSMSLVVANSLKILKKSPKQNKLALDKVKNNMEKSPQGKTDTILL